MHMTDLFPCHAFICTTIHFSLPTQRCLGNNSETSPTSQAAQPAQAVQAQPAQLLKTRPGRILLYSFYPKAFKRLWHTKLQQKAFIGVLAFRADNLFQPVLNKPKLGMSWKESLENEEAWASSLPQSPVEGVSDSETCDSDHQVSRMLEC